MADVVTQVFTGVSTAISAVKNVASAAFNVVKMLLISMDITDQYFQTKDPNPQHSIRN